jgi:hypothetical protein
MKLSTGNTDTSDSGSIEITSGNAVDEQTNIPNSQRFKGGESGKYKNLFYQTRAVTISNHHMPITSTGSIRIAVGMGVHNGGNLTMTAGNATGNNDNKDHKGGDVIISSGGSGIKASSGDVKGMCNIVWPCSHFK